MCLDLDASLQRLMSVIKLCAAAKILAKQLDILRRGLSGYLPLPMSALGYPGFGWDADLGILSLGAVSLGLLGNEPWGQN